MNLSLTKPKILIIVAFFCIYVFWGSTYLWNKMLVQQMPPLLIGGVRFSLAGTILYLIAMASGQKLKMTYLEVRNSLIAGVLFLSVGNGIFVWALRYVDSGFAALLASLQPLLVLIILRIYHQKPVAWRSLVGIILGIGGVVLLVSEKDLAWGSSSLLGILMIFGCVLSWSCGTVFVSQTRMHTSFLVNSAVQMFSSGVLLFTASNLLGEKFITEVDWNLEIFGLFALLISFGSIAAFTSFNYLLRTVNPVSVTTSAYVNPVIAILLGWYFLNERLSAVALGAAAVMLTGVYLINTRKTH